MAKVGFWLKGANGKLAGATVYQSNGETIMREVVKPTDAKTTGQILQRIKLASVSTPMKVVLLTALSLLARGLTATGCALPLTWLTSSVLTRPITSANVSMQQRQAYQILSSQRMSSYFDTSSFWLNESVGFTDPFSPRQ